MRRSAITFLSLVGLIIGTQVSRATVLSPELSLETLVSNADLICKVEMISSKPDKEHVNSERGFEMVETELKVISVFKGSAPAETITLRHYAATEKHPSVSFSTEPPCYEFKAGRAYIIFARETDAAGVYLGSLEAHQKKKDQGLLLAADKKPHAGKTVNEVFWTELTGLLKSKDADDVVYAIRQLDAMSGGGWFNLKDFPRKQVLEAVQPLIRSGNPAIAEEAIEVLGCNNPYMEQGHAPFWLAGIGHGYIPGLVPWDPSKEYPGGKLFWKELAAVADKDSPVKIRALAIRAMGRCCEPEILELARRWVKSPQPEIREAAVLLLADFPDKVGEDELRVLARDESARVRKSAALTIGFGQFVRLVPTLGKMLSDPDPDVVAAAALSLVSFSPDQNREVLKANLDHPQFKSVFVNALAREDAGPYLKQLGEAIRNGWLPEHCWWSPSDPSSLSWEILLRHVQNLPAETLKEGKSDACLDALEYPVKAGSKKHGYYGCSPSYLYALYVARGLKERAEKYRDACEDVSTHDIGKIFDHVEKSPSAYLLH